MTWYDRYAVPRANMQLWYSMEDADSDTILDYSGNNRDLSSGASKPTLQSDVINDRPAMYFDGTKSPFTYDGMFTLRHLFVVAAFEDPVFPATYGGLFTDQSVGDLLVGNPGSANFFNSAGWSNAGGYIYRLADVEHPEATQIAPVNGNFKVIEILHDAWTMDGVQIGQDRSFTDRLWKGWFAEAIGYSSVQDDYNRCEIYKYFALKYHLWQENSDGLKIFPFPSDRTRSRSISQEHYLSEPYTGTEKVLTRGGKVKSFNPQYLVRSQDEFEAAEAFWNEHYPDPANQFVFRDFNLYPVKDSTCRFSSSLEEQGSDLKSRFNYGFSAIET